MALLLFVCLFVFRKEGKRERGRQTEREIERREGVSESVLMSAFDFVGGVRFLRMFDLCVHLCATTSITRSCSLVNTIVYDFFLFVHFLLFPFFLLPSFSLPSPRFDVTDPANLATTALGFNARRTIATIQASANTNGVVAVYTNTLFDNGNALTGVFDVTNPLREEFVSPMNDTKYVVSK